MKPPYSHRPASVFGERFELILVLYFLAAAGYNPTSLMSSLAGAIIALLASDHNYLLNRRAFEGMLRRNPLTVMQSSPPVARLLVLATRASPAKHLGYWHGS